MTKESATWLVIRTLGLVLLGQACFQLYAIAVQTFIWVRLDQISGAVEAAADRQALRVLIDAAISAMQAIVVGTLAFYFLRRGRTVHRVLMQEAS